MAVDFMIVGQGIAGSVLSLSLIRSGYSVVVVDDPSLSSCSSVAAGIWNPVVFKRLTKSWLADEVVPELNEFYTYAETLFGTRLLHQRQIIKPFSEEQEKNLWIKKAGNDHSFLDPQTYRDLAITATNRLADYSYVRQAGNLDVKLFLKNTADYIKQYQQYIEERFDYRALQLSEEGRLFYKDTKARNIVFCEGHLISKNPFFDWIPMKPAKGELLTIYCEELLLENDILNKGIFILPVSPHTYKVGATYNWEQLNDEKTDVAKEELLAKLRAIISVPFEVIKHEAGVRPAVIDRRPLVGPHPVFEDHFVFNGFGTKAVMLSPYFAKQFVDFIKDGKPLDKEVEVKRFYKD